MNYLGIDRDKLYHTVVQLNNLLANYNVYYQNLRNFHWNVQGQNFFDLHETFENLYNDAKLKIDEIAERIRTLQHKPISKWTDYLEYAEIKESEILEIDEKTVEVLLYNHKILIANMRETIKSANECEDEGTIDMIGGFLSSLEKSSWMLHTWMNKVNDKSNIKITDS